MIKITKLLLVFSALLVLVGSAMSAEIKPKSGANSSNTLIFDGNELKPKSGANSNNTWVYDGREFRPKSGANSNKTWVFDGSELKPKSGANSSNTWVLMVTKYARSRVQTQAIPGSLTAASSSQSQEPIQVTHLSLMGEFLVPS